MNLAVRQSPKFSSYRGVEVTGAKFLLPLAGAGCPLDGRVREERLISQTMPPAPRILIIRLSAIGDCVMASPLAQTLRAHFPDAHIAWAVQDKSRAVVEGNPFIDEIIPWHGGFKGLFAAARLARARRFDVVLETQGLLKSTLLMALAGAPRRLVSPNFGRLAKLFATEVIEHPPGWIYPPDRYLYWARALGAPLPERARLTVPQSPADRERAAEFLRRNQVPDGALLIGLNPGCSAPSRKWSVENFGAVAQTLAGEFPGARFVLLGGPQDRDDSARLAPMLPGKTVDAAGQLPLRASAALISRCALLLTNDSGPMHLAVALETPVVAICGPIAAARRLPLHGADTIHVGVESGSGRVEDVTPGEVVAAARGVLEKREVKSGASESIRG